MSTRHIPRGLLLLVALGTPSSGNSTPRPAPVWMIPNMCSPQPTEYVPPIIATFDPFAIAIAAQVRHPNEDCIFCSVPRPPDPAYHPMTLGIPKRRPAPKKIHIFEYANFRYRKYMDEN